MRPELGQRLVTQNLLATASLYERKEQISWSTIDELSTLIDIACLYNGIRIVGRQAYAVYPNSGSRLFADLEEIIKVDANFSEPDQKRAANNLAAFLNDRAGPSRYERLVATTCSPDAIERAVGTDPDLGSHFSAAHNWFKQLPEAADPDHAFRNSPAHHREITFLVRSFLYLAYAGGKVVPFAPDQVRATALTPFIEHDQRWRQAILDSVKAATNKPVLYANIDVSRTVTPFSSIAFRRARTRADIGKEILALREELKSVRSRLLEAEDALFFATQQTEANAQQRWNEVFDELKAHFEAGHGLVRWRSLTGYTDKVAEAAVDQSKLLKLINLPIEIINRYLARRPVIEIHRLARAVPGSQSRAEDIRRLFGDVQ